MNIDSIMASSEEELNYGTETDSEEEQAICITNVRSVLPEENHQNTGLSDKNNNIMDTEGKAGKRSLVIIKKEEVKSNISLEKKVDGTIGPFREVHTTMSNSSSTSVSFASTESDGTDSFYSEEELYTKSQLQDVIFWLVTQQVKSFGRFKRHDIYYIGGLKGKTREAQGKFLKEVQERLSIVFGFDLKESTRPRGYFFLLNQFEYPLKLRKSEHKGMKEHNRRPDSKLKIEKFECNSKFEQQLKCQYGLLFVVLSLIYMSPGKTIDDSGLNTFLTKMGLMKDKKTGKDVNDDIICLFGKNCKEILIKQWVNAKYIDIVNTHNRLEGNIIEYKWGERAELEITKTDILKHVSQTYNVKESAFKEQYEEAYRK